MSTPGPSAGRRVAAVAALLAYFATGVAVVVLLVDDLVALVAAWVAVIALGLAAWFAATRRGVKRWVGLSAAVLAIAALLTVLFVARAVLEVAAVVALVAVATFLAHVALRPRVATGPPPGRRMPKGARPVLLLNPRSGGGKVERFGLVDEAKRRSVEPIVLAPGDDLEALARDAVARGADVLGMAGGDGSQALVAAIASEHDLPFVCIPAGTRNHLALDLGVDRDDVVGALDAYVEGYERRVDLATVNDRVFVNNVSLGVYAKVVQSDAYRDDKIGTVADMLPDLLGPACEPFDLRFDIPPDGEHDHADLVLVSNNRYELERIGGFGSRARLDEGVLGIVTVEVRTAAEVATLVAAQTAGRISRFSGFRSWTAPAFEVRSGAPVEAGIDGEAVVLPPPLRFAIVPGALRVRIAPHHPGQSPALATREHRTLAGLVRVARGRNPRADRAPSQDLGRSRG